jgi:hypothetical protein
MDYKQLFQNLGKRYSNITPETLQKILCPKLLPISSMDKTIIKLPNQNHWRASFEIELDSNSSELMTVGRTGKFVPSSYVNGNGVWQEIAKGRIINIDNDKKIANGEIYVGASSPKIALEKAIINLSHNDYLEIDQYGASAKILSALVEYNLSEIAKGSGYSVKRMPEDCAKHLGSYYNYDFEFEKNGIVKRVEVKSLWGTDTRYARSIHSLNKNYLTSSCKFASQDIFAVSLFLRTGNPMDFAFAKSISSETDSEIGLPYVHMYPEHVNQNPPCEIDNKIWFDSIDGVWN